MWNKVTNMVLAVDFLVVVNEWWNSPLDFMGTEVRILAVSCGPLSKNMIPSNGAKNLYSLPEVNSLLQVYGSRNSNKNSKYEYRSHEEQCQGEHEKIKKLRFNPNIILPYSSKNKK